MCGVGGGRDGEDNMLRVRMKIFSVKLETSFLFVRSTLLRQTYTLHPSFLLPSYVIVTLFFRFIRSGAQPA